MSLSDKTLLKHRILLFIGLSCWSFLVMGNKIGKWDCGRVLGFGREGGKSTKDSRSGKIVRGQGLAKQAWYGVGFSVCCPEICMG